jgi:hypothetical protein
MANFLESSHGFMHNRDLLRAIHNLLNHNRMCVAGVNNTFIIHNGDKDTTVVKDRPVLEDQCVNCLLEGGVQMG